MGDDQLVICHLQPQLTQLHTPGHTEQEQANKRNTPNAPGRTLPRPGRMPPPRRRQQRTKCGHPDPEANLSSHPKLCPGNWGQVPPDTSWSGGKRLPSQTGTGPPRVPPCAQGPGWCSLALPPRVTPGPKFSWPCQSGTGAERRAPGSAPPSPRAPKLGGRGDSPPLHIWPWPPGSAVENSRPRFSLSPSSLSVPAARLRDSPSSRLRPARPTSFLPQLAPSPGRRLGGQAAGEPLQLPSVFIPSPQTLGCCPFSCRTGNKVIS